MNNILLTPIENLKTEENLLSAFKENKTTHKIHQGMSPKEVAEVVSDHLMNIIEKQFEEAKDRFHKNK